MATSYTVSNVNIGTYPNDGQGDPLRTAFTKINKNFSNVYQMALAGGGGNVDFSGNIVVGGNLIANIAVIANSITSKGNVTANYFIGDGSKLSGITSGGSGLPTQYNQSGKFLTTDGTNPSWATVIGGGSTPMSAGDIVNTLKVSTVDLSTLVSALSTVAPVDLSGLASALSNIAPVNLTALNTAMQNVSTVNLGGLANALATLAPVNLNALNNALSTINLSAISNFTNAAAVVTTVATNPATGFPGQQIYNTTDSKLFVWSGSPPKWSNVAATYTPTASDMAKVEIVDVASLASLTGTLFEGRTVYNKNNSNLYIYVNSAWSSYNSFIRGSGTPSISAGSLNDPAYFSAGVITADKIATGAIVAGKIAAGAITATEIASGTITAGLLAADSVIAGKIKAGTITGDKIGAGNIWGNTIMAGTITGDLIKVNSLYGNTIMAGTITGNEIKANSVGGWVITANTLFANAIQAYTITANLLAANAVTAMSVAANAIYGNSIMAYTLTGEQIKANSVAGWVITANTLYANAIQAYTITANLLAANAVTSMSVAANAIYGNSIMAFTLTGDRLRANTITANLMAANSILAIHVNANAITADKIDSRGLSIRDASGAILFSAGTGVLSTAVKLDNGSGGSTTLSALFAAAGSASSPITYIGSGATNPASGSANQVFKNTTNGNTYIWDTTIATPAWVIFLAKATDGVGTPGVRGNYSIAATTTGSIWSNTTATDAIIALDGTGVKNRDQVTLYNSASKFSETRFYDTTANGGAGAWTAISAYINGGLLVDGTISAKKLLVDSLSALSANIGVITTGKIQGDVQFSGNISAASGTFSGKLTAGAIDAVDTVNITNSAVTSVLSVKLNTPFVLNGYAAGGGSINPGGAIYKIDVLTTGWVKIPNPSSVTTFFTMNSYGQDTWQYLTPSITPEVRRETQYYRIRAIYGGNGASPSAAVIANPWSSYSTPVDQPFRILDRFIPPSDAIKVNQITLGDSSSAVTAPGWYQFVVDMIVLPGPGSIDEQSFVFSHGGDISIVGTTDAVTAIANNQWTDRYGSPNGGPSTTYNYNNPSDVWGYGVFLVSNRPIFNAWYTGFPYLYHRFNSGSLTVIVAKK